MKSHPSQKPYTPLRCVAVMLSFLFLLGMAMTMGAEGMEAGNVNLAAGATYWISQPAEDRYPDSGGELTDGIKADVFDLFHEAWQGHRREDLRVITVDLGGPRRIDSVVIGFLNELNASVTVPNMIQLTTSETGSDWTDPIILLKSQMGPIGSPERKEVSIGNLDRVARYVRLTLYVDVWVFLDEIEVWGEEGVVEGASSLDQLDRTDPLLGSVKETGTMTIQSDRTPQSVTTEQAREYLPIGSPDAAGIRHLKLIYTHKDWNLLDALPYVAYSRRDSARPLAPAVWEDWFFDSFLFLSQITPGGARGLQHANIAPPARWEDWMWFLDYLFHDDQQLGAFDRAIARAKESIDDPDYKAKVFIMVPYPIPSQTDFGDPFGIGKSLSFSASGQGVQAQRDARFSAVTAYLDELFRRWDTSQYEHLEFVGLYWMGEYIDGNADLGLIQDVAQHIKPRDLRFIWIPFYTARGWDQWKEAGFDAAIYQPNYMFDPSIPISRFLNVTDRAKAHRMGIEIESDWTVLDSDAGRQRYFAYLRAGVQYGFMEQAVHGHFHSVDILLQAFYSRDEEVRRLYDATYEYVKGTYDPSSDQQR